MMKKVLCWLNILLIFSGCASFPKNPPITQLNNPSDYRFNNLLAENEMGDNFVGLTLSGGGTRAGALAYGVMKELERTKLPQGDSLLDEVKVISSVSGGSFVSSYYGLYGKEKFFRDFKDAVLYRKLSSHLIGNLFRFINWVPAAIFGDVGRSEVAEKMYERNIFKGHTFADMPRKWPFIIINSTDMSRGTTLSFIQEDLDKICSDVNQIKIARAVVASSAFPGPFTPLTFKNYPSSQCGYQTPAWAKEVLSQHPEINPEEYVWAKHLKSYEDAKTHPYIHLFDGGVADNLGLIPIYYQFRTGGWNLLDNEKHFKAKRLIVIVVDAKTIDDLVHDRRPNIPRFITTLLNAATLPMGNYTVKTVQDMALRFSGNRVNGENFSVLKELCDKVYPGEAERKACYDRYQTPFGGKIRPPFPEFYFIHVQFDAIRDEALRKKVGGIGTNLQLKKSDVDLLEKMGGIILQESPSFQKLVHDLGASTETKKEPV
jgi:NTE family protein